MKIPIPAIPTDEEMERIAKKWWLYHFGVNFLDWNEALNSHTIPYRVVKIPKKLVAETFQMENNEKVNYEKIVREYTALLAPALVEMGCEGNFFIKTISRSPKDYLSDGGKPIALTSVYEAIWAITSSMRCLDDGVLLYALDKFYLVVRPYVDFKERDEWRVYVEDGKIVGISQYYYTTPFGYSQEELAATEKSIRDFMRDIVLPNVSIPSYVADIVFNPKPLLLELNPFGLSDPCLFGSYNSLDGSMKHSPPPSN